MGTQILSFLLDVVAGLLGGACLLRLYMQRQKVPFGNPIGRFVFALTDWIVLPLRRVLPPVARWDTASLVAAYLIELVQYLILWAVIGFALESVFLLALVGLVRLILSALTALVLVYAILSWVQSDSLMTDLIDRLVAPLLRPFRRVIPLVGGIDLSPLALLVLLQVLSMVLTALVGRGF
ncbi:MULTISPECIES: YggT family protein [Ramlibacter]|uniref:YggT family protein n=1 Tax=Ramlibacter pinisoli TaxID=2682844 RepID=A0A6N8IQL8_9BURK|nr:MULTISPECIES: YggT family protein [Ramlibacter]MBA2964138.1 YggT family protein [Ramlibacter sp. CGMCC 1.13660]MVQ29104.1 YggT family protein [Ramlibacter pinisoli]